MDDVTWVVVVVAMNGIALLVHLRLRRSERKRTERFAQLAEQLGFEFSADGDAFWSDLRLFPLFLLDGRSKRLWNLMRGQWHGLEVAVFDYEYVTGQGKHTSKWPYSVVRLAFKGPCLPSFALHTRDDRYKVVSKFGYKDIYLEGLSNRFRLRGFYDDEESAIRQLFTADVIEFYEQRVDLSTESSGDVLLVYRASRVKPEAVLSFMEEGLKAFSLYRPVG